MAANHQVREFLTSRRARLTPDAAGLPAYGGNRRVPGLRREEVALLAGVSVDYYNRLERGNLAGVSDSVLEAVARALHLDEAEVAHLHDLARAANTTPTQRRRTSPAQIRPAVVRLVEAMTDVPAWIRNDRHDLLAINRLGAALYAPVLRDPRRPANTARFTFLDPAAQTSSPTGTRPPPTSSRSSAPPPAATRTTATSPTSSASCPPGARSSAPAGLRTTSASTAPAARPSTTPSSVCSTSSSRP